MLIQSKYKSVGKIVLLFALFSIFLGYACRKSSHYVWLSYNETQCADAWPISTNNETLKNNIVDFFKSKGITIYDTEIFASYDAETFNSCSSKSGRVIKCKIKENQVSDIKSYGFYE